MNTEQPNGEEADLISRLEEARKLYDNLKAALNVAIARLDAFDGPLDRANSMASLTRDYHKASLQVTDYEVALGKRRETILGTFGGGGIDIEAAREEILGRITRFRDRG